MTNSTRRALRTVGQVAAALVIVLPLVLPALGVAETSAAYAAVVGVAAALAKLMNRSEDADDGQTGEGAAGA